MTCEVPVLLLTFNRPEQTRRVLERITAVKPPRLYVHCDGPRPAHRSDEQQVKAVQHLINTKIDGTGIELMTFFRTKNAGLRQGVFEAISWFFDHEPYGIILEDDCVPDPTAFRFCAELLLEYQDDPQIMHIGCSNLSEMRCTEMTSSYLFSNFPFVWGWASWRRAWEKMELHFDGIDALLQTRDLAPFLSNPKAKVYLMDKFIKTKGGKINSWAYAWFYSILKTGGLCIVPKVNLVQNVGIGGANATNTRKQNTKAELRANQMTFPLVHPGNRAIEPNLEDDLFYSTQKSEFRLALWSILKAVGIR